MAPGFYQAMWPSVGSSIVDGLGHFTGGALMYLQLDDLIPMWPNTPLAWTLELGVMT